MYLKENSRERQSKLDQKTIKRRLKNFELRSKENRIESCYSQF